MGASNEGGEAPGQRRPRIPGVFERGATPLGGMHRRPNAVPIYEMGSRAALAPVQHLPLGVMPAFCPDLGQIRMTGHEWRVSAESVPILICHEITKARNQTENFVFFAFSWLAPSVPN